MYIFLNLYNTRLLHYRRYLHRALLHCPNVVFCHLHYLIKAVQWVDSQTIVACQMVWAWRSKFLGTTNIFVAYVMYKRWALVKIRRISKAHCFESTSYSTTAELVTSGWL